MQTVSRSHSSAEALLRLFNREIDLELVKSAVISLRLGAAGVAHIVLEAVSFDELSRVGVDREVIENGEQLVADTVNVYNEANGIEEYLYRALCYSLSLIHILIVHLHYGEYSAAVVPSLSGSVEVILEVVDHPALYLFLGSADNARGYLLFQLALTAQDMLREDLAVREAFSQTLYRILKQRKYLLEQAGHFAAVLHSSRSFGGEHVEQDSLFFLAGRLRHFLYLSGSVARDDVLDMVSLLDLAEVVVEIVEINGYIVVLYILFYKDKVYGYAALFVKQHHIRHIFPSTGGNEALFARFGRVDTVEVVRELGKISDDSGMYLRFQRELFPAVKVGNAVYLFQTVEGSDIEIGNGVVELGRGYLRW